MAGRAAEREDDESRGSEGQARGEQSDGEQSSSAASLVEEELAGEGCQDEARYELADIIDDELQELSFRGDKALRGAGGPASPASPAQRAGHAGARRKEEPRRWAALSMGGLSLDEDVAQVDRLLVRTSGHVVACWLALVAGAYWAAPAGCIQRLAGTERNACLVELSILATAVAMKHGPLLWEMNLLRRPGDPWPAGAPDKLRLSGVLAGGLTVQFIAVSTALIMVCCPVPVMRDPVLGSRVHLLRWCEWAPLAAFMTLMTECIDAPHLHGPNLSHDWRKKFHCALLEGLSTFCGLLFPFCPGPLSWAAVMLLSFLTFSAIFIRYFEKKKAFQSVTRGSSVDEIELYDRARMSLALLSMCCVIWTMMTVMYFVSSCGHLILSDRWTIFHDPAATMISECFMDLVAKILYMTLIIEAHYAAFDEAKRANRRLAELKNTLSVVWENSSDVIAISVRKMSGDVTSMVSPSFFRHTINLCNQEQINDISAVVLELKNRELKRKKEPLSYLPTENVSSRVGVRIIHKADFSGLDLHSTSKGTDFTDLTDDEADLSSINLHVLAFTDMLARAWQSKPDEFVLEHDVVLNNEGSRRKFEVKVTKLEQNAIVIVVRDVSERHRRFEAEKRFVYETAARQKDAEASRFTRHEVKNGLLAAIEICGNIREQFSEDVNHLTIDGGHVSGDIVIFEKNLNSRVDNISELDRALHEVLDIVLAETMARDVIHEMYIPRMERVDINYILSHMRGFKANHTQFSLLRSPCPLPVLLSDQGLLKCIHSNAIRNALKYGRKGGKIITDATYDSQTGMFTMKIINMPGPGHKKLVALGSRASELVFSHGTRLHKDSFIGARSHSAGDGAWIIQKCTNILGGHVEIYFEETRTVFEFRAPVKVYDSPLREVQSFQLPPGVWGIAIDDSKIQRKLLRRFFIHAGIQEHHQVILGKEKEEISGFIDFVVDFVNRHADDRFFIIADENLEIGDIGDHVTISGSECIERIRNKLDTPQEKRIMALVRSANDSPKDLALYSSRAHGYMPKVPLQGVNVREMVAPLWVKRFPRVKKELETNEDEESDSEDEISRFQSIENLRDLTLISPAELLQDVEQIDAITAQYDDTINLDDRWPMLWEKLHQLKGDLKSVNVDNRFSKTIALIESLRGSSAPADFTATWIRIRSDVVTFDITK